MHTRIPFNLVTAEGIATFRRFIERAADLVVSYGGSFSGEHGDGQSRGELLPRMFGDDLVRAFGQFKAVFDPGNRMNPGKVVAPYRIDENLRLGTSWVPRDYDAFFAYPDDDGRFEPRGDALRGRRQVPRTATAASCAPPTWSRGRKSTPPGAGEPRHPAAAAARPSRWPSCSHDHTARLAAAAAAACRAIVADPLPPPRHHGLPRATRRCLRAAWAWTSTCSTRAAAGSPATSASRLGHYDVSRGLRRAGTGCPPCAPPATTDTLVLADGFSCRTQIEQGGTARTPVHLAELLADGLRGQPARPSRPEAPDAADYVQLAAGAMAAAALAAGLGAAARRRRNQGQVESPREAALIMADMPGQVCRSGTG